MRDPIILVAYATREGQTRTVAEHVALTLGTRGIRNELVDVAKLTEPFDVARFSAAILAASVHTGKHEREMVDFVRRHRETLVTMPTAFLSVSGGEATVELGTAPDDVRAKTAEGVKHAIDVFEKETGWYPDHAHPVAGAILYTKYNPLVRFMLRHIVKKEGGPTDTSRDWIFTDYHAVERFADEIARAVVP